MANTAEEATLFAVMSEDYAEARRLLDDALPGELRQFANWIVELDSMIRETIEEKIRGEGS